MNNLNQDGTLPSTKKKEIFSSFSVTGLPNKDCERHILEAMNMYASKKWYQFLWKRFYLNEAIMWAITLRIYKDIHNRVVDDNINKIA